MRRALGVAGGNIVVAGGNIIMDFSTQNSSAPLKPTLIAIAVTYQRPTWLERSLMELDQQTVKPSRVVIIDNAPSDESVEIASRARGRGQSIEYLPQDENLGPAGAIAVGMNHVMSTTTLDESAWVLLLDDDNPPSEHDDLERLLTFADEMLRRDPSTAGVGKTGSRFIPSRARLSKVPDAPDLGPYRVDYIGGGQLPLFRLDAIRSVGAFDRRMFFGFDDLEFGLRLGYYGYRLYVDGTQLNHRRALDHRRRSRDVHTGSAALRRWWRGLESTFLVGAPPPWRHYYSTRNLIYILRSEGLVVAPLVVSVRSLAKPTLNVIRGTAKFNYISLTCRAIVDGWRSIMGRRIDPPVDLPREGSAHAART